MPSTFAQDIEDYAAGHCPAVELWLNKLETHHENHSATEIKRLLEDHGVAAPAAGFHGGLLISQGEARRLAWDQFRQRLDLLCEIGVDTLVVSGDLFGPLEPQDLERATVSLQQAAEEAQRRNVLIALEFQSRAVFANNLHTAAALLRQINHSSLGICLDAFHFYTGPSKESDLNVLTVDNLFHVQLCDIADVPRETASDSDRILPGEGDITLTPIIDHLRAIDYQRAISIEIMNPEIWRTPPRQFGEIAITALRKLLGQSDMG